MVEIQAQIEMNLSELSSQSTGFSMGIQSWRSVCVDCEQMSFNLWRFQLLIAHSIQVSKIGKVR